jgi:hypothetical protein
MSHLQVLQASIIAWSACCKALAEKCLCVILTPESMFSLLHSN